MHIYNYHKLLYNIVKSVLSLQLFSCQLLFLFPHHTCTVSAFIFSCFSCNWMICGYNCRECVVRAVTRVVINECHGVVVVW